MIKRSFLYLIFLILIVPLFCSAAGGGAAGAGAGVEAGGSSLPNYLACDSFEGCITKLIDAVNPIIMVLAVFFIVLSGYKFLTAQGDPGKIKDAQTTFTWTAIGVAIVVGAELIIRVLKDILQTL